MLTPSPAPMHGLSLYDSSPRCPVSKGGDANAMWGPIVAEVAVLAGRGHLAGPGGWNYPDSLEVGNAKHGRSLTPDEARAHFALWCITSSPLILGNDVRNMSADVTLPPPLAPTTTPPLPPAAHCCPYFPSIYYRFPFLGWGGGWRGQEVRSRLAATPRNYSKPIFKFFSTSCTRIVTLPLPLPLPFLPGRRASW